MRFMPMYINKPEVNGSSIRTPLPPNGQLTLASCARMSARSKGKRRLGCAVRRSIA